MVLNARIALVSLVLGALLVPQTQTRTTPPAPVCHARPDLAGPCFAVHGALRYSNGGTPVKIWKIGTTRLLGVAGLGETGLPDDSTKCPLPDRLRDTLEAGKEVVANFLVCPLTREQPGIMQLVCVDSAAHVRAKPFRF